MSQHSDNSPTQAEPFDLKSFMKDSSVSGLSASLTQLPLHPLYTLKSQMMYHGNNFSFRKFLKRTKATTGMFLFQGVVPRSVGVAPEKALKMMAWSGSLHLIDNHYPQCPQTLCWMIGGTVAGAATTIIGCPSERAMVLAQVQKQGFRAVVRSTGVKGLYHGVEATLYRDITFNQIIFVLREMIMSWHEKRYGRKPDPFARIWWGLPASVAAGIIACPFDVVKTRVQGKELATISHQRPLQIMLSIARDEGPRYLFKGLLPRLVSVPLYMSVFFTVNEELQKAILHK